MEIKNVLNVSVLAAFLFGSLSFAESFPKMGVAVPRNFLNHGDAIQLNVYELKGSHSGMHTEKVKSLMVSLKKDTEKNNDLYKIDAKSHAYYKYIDPVNSSNDDALGYIFAGQGRFSKGNKLEFCLMDTKSGKPKKVVLSKMNTSGCFEIYGFSAIKALHKAGYGFNDGHNNSKSYYTHTSNPGFNLGWEND